MLRIFRRVTYYIFDRRDRCKVVSKCKGCLSSVSLRLRICTDRSPYFFKLLRVSEGKGPTDPFLSVLHPVYTENQSTEIN